MTEESHFTSNTTSQNLIKRTSVPDLHAVTEGDKKDYVFLPFLCYAFYIIFTNHLEEEIIKCCDYGL